MFYTNGRLYFTLLHPFLLQVSYVLVIAVIWVSAKSIVIEGLVHRVALSGCAGISGGEV